MRMKMYYGEDFQAELWTKEGKGTRFIFTLPLPPTERTGSRIRQVTGYPFDKAHRMEHSSRKQKMGEIL